MSYKLFPKDGDNLYEMSKLVFNLLSAELAKRVVKINYS